MKKLYIGLLTLSVMFINLVAVTPRTSAVVIDEDTEIDTITICHRTNSVKNPYVEITVSVEASNRPSVDDHTSHTGPVATSEAVAQALKNNMQKWGDIIPPYDNFPGLNWDEDGSAIHKEGCSFSEVEEATPAAPIFVAPTCTTKGNYTIPTSTGIEYFVNGVLKVAGKYDADNGTSVTVVGEATEDFYVADDTVDTWNYTFTAPTNCSTPSVLGTTTPTPQVVVPKGAVNAGVGSSTTNVVAGFAGSFGLVILGLATRRLFNR